ncbi:hypothetical protein PINS_up012782 [Pythium insidiosum]|nr:hypothetical protein PINS_up012782 [Pythium insidiosum]
MVWCEASSVSWPSCCRACETCWMRPRHPSCFTIQDDNPTRLVGKRVRVKWAKEKWYEGVVERFDEVTYEHFVVYDDGDKRNYRMSEKAFYVVEQQASPSREGSSRRRGGS